MACRSGPELIRNGLILHLDSGNYRSFDPEDVISGAAQTAYTTAGSYSFVVPVGITSISAVCVGGGGGGGGNTATNADAGGGGGGGLGYGTFAVTPGQTLTIVVGSGGLGGGSGGSNGTSGGASMVSSSTDIFVQGGGGVYGEGATQNNYGDGGSGGTFSGISTAAGGGGNGGNGGNGGGTAGSGGGAGGYSGNGGNGNGGANDAGGDGAGGGGGGGGGNYSNVGPQQGGGVGILGEGTSGTGGPANNGSSQVDGNPGSGGSGVTYGGGGGGAYRSAGGNTNLTGANGGGGAVRLVYQPTIGNRQYPTLANIADTTYTLPNTTWKDLSDNENTATLSGATFNGANGGVLVLNGTSDYVVTGSDMFNANSNFTFSMWFNSDDFSEQKAFVADVDNSQSLFLRYNSGIQVVNSNTAVLGSFTSSTLSTNTWHNVTVTRSSNTYRLYVDGNYKSLLIFSHTFSHSPNTIGANHNYGGGAKNFFDGKIAKVLAYSTALSDSEVLRSYRNFKSRF